MKFLSPLAFLLFAVSLPLVLLYFLKVRRRERRVPSLMLWDAGAARPRGVRVLPAPAARPAADPPDPGPRRARAWRSRGPAVTVMGEGARKVVVVLDTSASMKARDVSPSRFDRAKARRPRWCAAWARAPRSW